MFSTTPFSPQPSVHFGAARPSKRLVSPDELRASLQTAAADVNQKIEQQGRTFLNRRILPRRKGHGVQTGYSLLQAIKTNGGKLGNFEVEFARKMVQFNAVNWRASTFEWIVDASKSGELKYIAAVLEFFADAKKIGILQEGFRPTSNFRNAGPGTGEYVHDGGESLGISKLTPLGEKLLAEKNSK